MAAISMSAQERIGSTRGGLRQLRLSGRVPAVVYGKGLSAPANISVSEKDVASLLRSHPNAVLELDVPTEGKQSVMISAIQRDSLLGTLLHVDFHQINMNEEVKASVRIETTGDSQGVREGGIVQVILHELEIQCLPGSIPESIEVDITALEVGGSLLVSDLKLPRGVTAKSDPQLVVVTVLAPQKELQEDEKEAQDAEASAAEERSEEAKHAEIATSV